MYLHSGFNIRDIYVYDTYDIPHEIYHWNCKAKLLFMTFNVRWCKFISRQLLANFQTLELLINQLLSPLTLLKFLPNNSRNSSYFSSK